ncbi:O-methyltransferase [Thozetella sp. PMI_491]|nr:O-methyltransferase [Thozetella sp. PMI_491]
MEHARGKARWNELRDATEQLNAVVGQLSCPEAPGEDLDKAQCSQIFAAAQKILALTKDPYAMGFEVITQLCLITANRIFWEWGVFDAIPIDGSISYAELATKLDAEVSLLERLGAVIVSSGVLKQVGRDGVAHTPQSSIFINDHPAGFTVHMGWDNAMSSFSHYPQYFRTYGRKEPQTEDHVPVTFANGTPELTYYEVIKRDPPRMNVFMRAMAPLEANQPMAGIYDFSWLVAHIQSEPNSDRLVFVDVGGGGGQAIKAIHNEFPALPLPRFMLQDTTEMIQTAKALQDPELQDIQMMAIDFHQEQPVKGALTYWIRRCLHNYGDKVVVNILRNLAEALAEDSRLLIQEDIKDSTPNQVSAVVDMMMINFGGKQRTLECWEQVMSEAGLRISSISRITGKSIAVLECMKK